MDKPKPDVSEDVKETNALNYMRGKLLAFEESIDKKYHANLLAQEMLSQSGKAHHTKQASQETSRAWLAQRLVEEWKHIADEVLLSFDLPQGKFNLSKQFEPIRDNIVAKNVGSLFVDARQQALKQQIEKLNRGAYPEFQIVDAINNRNSWTKNDEDAIVKKLSANQALFEENELEVQKIANIIHKDIDLQRDNQLKVVSSLSPPTNVVSKEAIATYLQGRLDDALNKERDKEAKSNSGRIVYERLSKINFEITKTAERLEQRGFVNFLTNFPIASPDANTLKTEIKNHLGQHKNFDISLNKFVSLQQFPAHKCLYKTIGCVSRLHSCAVHVEYRLECAGKPS
jgi:hypothetical protein